MSKHTPGPWYLLNGCDIFSALGADSGDGCKADRNDGWHIAEIPCTTTSVDGLGQVELGWGVRQANARLIAAAPELLEALRDALAAMEHMGDVMNGKDIVTDEDEAHFPAFAKARAAIAKAEGTS